MIVVRFAALCRRVNLVWIIVAVAALSFGPALAAQSNEPSAAQRKYVEEARKGAEGGDAKSQANLAFYYHIGFGVEQNDAEAAKWYRKAAEQGHLLAQEVLAGMYRDGSGVPKDYVEAARWYRRAADNETVWEGPTVSPRASALEQLGRLYEGGLGVPQDYIEAAKCYRNSVLQGNDHAAFWLYYMCVGGTAQKPDCAQVAKWLSVMADRDDSVLDPGVRLHFGTNVSQFYLGTLYEKGLGVPQDNILAAKWYRKSADQGNTDAQLNLAVLYVYGKGVPQDFVLAHMWLNLATSKSTAELQADMVKIRDMLAASMTPAQIAEAQRLAREWKPVGESESK
jgi:TPR repeat protein